MKPEIRDAIFTLCSVKIFLEYSFGRTSLAAFVLITTSGFITKQIKLSGKSILVYSNSSAFLTKINPPSMQGITLSP